MSTILVADTPHSAALLVPAVAERHPDAGPIVSVATNRISARGDAFRFPGMMSFGAFPAIRPVQHDPFLIDWGFAPRRKTSPISRGELVKEIEQADHVYLFACGSSRPAQLCHAAQMVRSHNPDTSIKVIAEHDFSPGTSRFAVRSAAPVEDYQPLFDAVAVEEHFEFNYRINSFALLGRLFERHGATRRPTISAAGLQFLLWIRKQEQRKAGHSFSREDLAVRLSLWTGTGKFNRVDSVGKRIPLSPRGYTLDPVQELLNRDLLVENERQLVDISDLGRAIADEFPVSCHDADQPFRIEVWRGQEPKQAMSQINGYLMSFFADHQSMTRASADEVIDVTYDRGA
jgi:hypothetical protein